MKLKILYLSLFIFVYACNGQTKKKEMLTQNKNIMIEKFDFIEYEKRVNNDPINGEFYTKPDGTLVEEINSTNPVRWEIPPKPSFVKVYKEFYPNGNMKREETYIGKITKTGISLYYDEKGNITKKVDEDSKFGKIRQKDILVFLEGKKRINIETGEGIFDERGNFMYNIAYNEETNLWYVTIPQGRPYTAIEMSEIMKNSIGEPSDWKPFEYVINGTTGEIISSDE